MMQLRSFANSWDWAATSSENHGDVQRKTRRPTQNSKVQDAKTSYNFSWCFTFYVISIPLSRLEEAVHAPTDVEPDKTEQGAFHPVRFPVTMQCVLVLICQNHSRRYRFMSIRQSQQTIVPAIKYSFVSRDLYPFDPLLNVMIGQ